MNTTARLGVFLDRTGITPSRIEKECRLSNGIVGRAIKLSSSIMSESLERIMAAHPELSAEWLMRGREPMLQNPVVTDNRAEEIMQRIDVICKSDDLYDAVITCLDAIISLHDNAQKNKKYRKRSQNIANVANAILR